MLRFVQELRGALDGLTEAQFVGNRLLTLAVEKLFINLGEAANRIDEAERAQIVEVPWRAIIGLRNVMAHAYETVDPATLFATAKQDLPDLQAALERLLSEC